MILSHDISMSSYRVHLCTGCHVPFSYNEISGPRGLINIISVNPGTLIHVAGSPVCAAW